jgi:cell division protein ZipA
VPELRWILTAIGVALIIGVYIWSRRGRFMGEREASRREPGLGERTDAWRSTARSEEPSLDMELGPEFAVTAEEHDPHAVDPPELPPEGEELIVALRLRARRPEGFDGAELIKVFSSEGLEYGRFGAFHSLDERRRSRFLVASLVEPGSFEIEKMHELRCPGISMFMVLPGPREPLAALDTMFTCARRLADRLDAEVLDDKGNALTMQQTGWLREQVVEYHRRSKLSAGMGSGRPDLL